MGINDLGIRDVREYLSPDNPHRFLLGLNNEGPCFVHYNRSQADNQCAKNIVIEPPSPSSPANFLATQLLLKGHDVVGVSRNENPLPHCTDGEQPDPTPSYYQQTHQKGRPFIEGRFNFARQQVDRLLSARSFWYALPLTGFQPLVGWVAEGEYRVDEQRSSTSLFKNPNVLGIFVRRSIQDELAAGLFIKHVNSNTYRASVQSSVLSMEPDRETLEFSTPR